MHMSEHQQHPHHHQTDGQPHGFRLAFAATTRLAFRESCAAVEPAQCAIGEWHAPSTWVDDTPRILLGLFTWVFVHYHLDANNVDANRNINTIGIVNMVWL